MARPMVRSRLGYLPDLVAVNATNGASGYYRVSDLEIPKTPEAVSYTHLTLPTTPYV